MFPKVLHHAYIVEGGISAREIVLAEVAQILDIDIHGQDFFVIESAMFGVDDATRAVDINSRKAFSGGKKAVCIIADIFSGQAQNALLKTLEEPTPGTHFFILTSSASVFLPTILSRVHVVTGKSDAVVLPPVFDVSGFLKASSAKRIAMVKEIMKEKEDEKIADRDIFMFLNELEKTSYTHTKGKSEELRVASVFTKVQDYIRDTSSSKKLLLEYVALCAPQI